MRNHLTILHAVGSPLIRLPKQKYNGAALRNKRHLSLNGLRFYTFYRISLQKKRATSYIEQRATPYGRPLSDIFRRVRDTWTTEIADELYARVIDELPHRSEGRRRRDPQGTLTERVSRMVQDTLSQFIGSPNREDVRSMMNAYLDQIMANFEMQG